MVGRNLIKSRRLPEVMPVFYRVRNLLSIVALAGGIILIMRGLSAPSLLFIGLVYLIGAAISFFMLRKADRFCSGMSGVALVLFVGIFFAPLWMASFFARTAEEHLHLAERYATRGQIFGSRDQVMKHYLAAAQKGSAEAQVRVGEVYLFGHYGENISRTEAIKWLQAAAVQGNSRAKNMLIAIK